MSQERRYSFEFFPTKTDAGHEKLMGVARQLATYNPDFFSCTYGAGGSTRDRTLNTVLQLENEVKVPAAPHLSCVGDSKDDLRALLAEYKAAGIKRIVALRGDLPSGMGMASGELRYASDLVEFIRQETADHFHLEVAAYPEMHPQARNFETDLANFVHKVKAGAEYFQTQAVFEPEKFIKFMEAAKQFGKPVQVGIIIPKSAGMCKFMNKNVAGVHIPDELIAELQADKEKTKAGITGVEIAARIIRECKPYCQGVHIMSLGWEDKIPALLEQAGL